MIHQCFKGLYKKDQLAEVKQLGSTAVTRVSANRNSMGSVPGTSGAMHRRHALAKSAASNDDTRKLNIGR